MMSNSLRAATQTADQSRPTSQTRETKNFGSFLWKRLTANRVSQGSTTMATSTMALSTTSYTPSPRKAYTNRVHRRRQLIVTGASEASSNLMQWLQTDCPQDLVPRILAYAGPQTMAVMSRTNRFWRDFSEKESTWRTLSEELYKWKEGDSVPESWLDFYKFNPCVPVDYSTVNAAFSIVRSPQMEQTRSIRVLLRPGRYVLREGITVQAPSSVRVEIVTMDMPDSFHPVDQTSTTLEVEPPRKRKSQKLRDILSCRNIEVEEPEDGLGAAEFLEPLTSIHSSALNRSSSLPSMKRATLVLRTRRHNEPLLRVRQGCVMLKNLELRHISHGLDIWNGNAAIQIQPPNGPDDQPMMVVPAPAAVLDHVEVTSASGRGIVNIDGGQVSIKSCYVHDCAATGIYVGGPGSKAEIERSDVVRNGNGNSQHRRGIARGHSGVYLEQGHASIVDCNISQNSLTGISAVSPENAILNLEESELVSNGTFQLEMPAVGSAAHRQSNTSNNTMATIGLATSRSGLVMDDY